MQSTVQTIARSLFDCCTPWPTLCWKCERTVRNAILLFEFELQGKTMQSLPPSMVLRGGLNDCTEVIGTLGSIFLVVEKFQCSACTSLAQWETATCFLVDETWGLRQSGSTDWSIDIKLDVRVKFDVLCQISCTV